MSVTIGHPEDDRSTGRNIGDNHMDIMNKDDTLKAIKSIKGRSGTLRSDIQAAAIGAMCHANDHGDFTLASKLVDAVSASNKAQLRAYFVEYMPVRNVKGKGFVKVKGKNAFRLPEAMDAYWDDFNKADKAERGYNAMTDIKSLIKAIEGRMDKATEADDDHMYNLYAEMRELAVR